MSRVDRNGHLITTRNFLLPSEFISDSCKRQRAMVDSAEQELLESEVARRISADAYCKGEERSVSLCTEETH